MKNQFTSEQETYISRIQNKRNINRKAAITFCKRHQWKALEPVRKVAFSQAAVAPAKDFKRAAANDKPEVVKAAKTDAGAARAEGLRLYKLAGRPSQSDVVKVYGTRKAIAWTWLRRAKALELATAEDAALKFQEMLASK